MNRFYELTISKITQLTTSSVMITFEVPELLKKVFHFEAGEYLTLQQTIGGEKVRRAYSICSGVNEGELSVAVKRVLNGVFSTYATTQLKAGDVLEVMPPKGSFVFFYDIFGNRDIMLFSAGSGVTPMMSIAKTALSKTNIKVVFVYGNKSKEEALFFDEIEALRIQYPERFLVHYAFSQQPWGDHYTGRINDRIVNEIFAKYKDLNWGRYYACGPTELVKNLREILLLRGIDKDRIFTELFEASPAEIDYSTLQGNVAITLELNGQTHSFESARNQTLLSSALLRGYDAPYSCLNGVCSSCIGRVEEGEAKMAKNETLSEEEVSQGYILTCQAYAMTDTIKVRF
ncbi:ferredoxin [Capnocytophaga ochracea DSM 7271]|uniref:Ferredoxin n=1 Tax=Capnocytophaga ochracea (strain ATCC 27872 / DSM 7271 / CCUG 9716 / JCM 12966 / NCTC 12371 / SS31 / VPI 2845) TaxID=521097 RepID=C7M3R1_CAPOD|nr:ferredoxin--NADP reductase [Capnocytophaga ochracea]ACU93687.1 ferredoxin [Capnocytophaga ochracea DSM 7271]UAK50299.1 ferredoxin--NADP reductase [Capnocytophaga ochracea]